MKTRILFIEEELYGSLQTTKALKKRGYKIDTRLLDAPTLDFYAKNAYQHYDVVVFDFVSLELEHLPLVEGLEKKDRKPRILVLTPRELVQEMTGERIALIEHVIDDYLVKPCSIDKIENAIVRLADPNNASLPLIVRFNSVYVNTRSRHVYQGSERIRLTRTEYRLLHLLMSLQGTVVSREKMAEELFPFKKTRPSSNVIDVHIKNLRKKIESDPKKPFIETVRGAGYKFNTA